VHSLYFEQHETDPKIKLCFCKEILNGIRKAGCIAHTISGTLWAIHKICCLSTLAYYSFTTLPTLPAWSILTNTPTKLSVLNSDSLTVGVGYGQIALLRRCELKFYPIIKRYTWASWQRFLGHLGVLTEVLGALGRLFQKEDSHGKNGTNGNHSLFTFST